MDLNYLDGLGARIRSQIPRAALPEEGTQGLFRIYAVLLLAKGTAVTAAYVHNAWVAWMLDTDPGHSAIVPYADLSKEVADDDLPFVRAIHAVAEELA